MNVLHVCASPRPTEESVSKQLAIAFFTKLAELNPDVDVTNVDLYHNPPPYLSNDAYRAMWQPVLDPTYTATDAEKKASTYSATQCQLFKDADILVLTMPMWNCGVPAIMKAWLDQVMAPGRIFTYGPEGVKPAHALRKVILLIASGAVFKENAPDDALTIQIKAAMEYIGVTDIVTAWADGQDPVMHSDCALRKSMAIEAAQEVAEEVATMTL